MTRAKTAHRIAFVSDAIYPYNKGGKETRLFEITTRLTKRGHDVHIYCMKWWAGSETTREENGITLHAISPYYPLYSGPRRSIKQGILFGLACLKLLLEPFDVVEVDHMPYFPLYSMKLVCSLRRKKLIAVWNEVWGKKYWSGYLPGIRGKIASIVESYSIKLPDVIFSISQHTTTNIADKLKPTCPVITIPCGVDVHYINRIKKAKVTNNIIYVGRLLAHKNINLLLKSIKIINETTKLSISCLIVGKGPEENNLKMLTKKLNISHLVKFKGNISKHADVISLIKSSSVLALPSFREGFGIVVLEANACGIPVVTLDYPENAAKDLIRNNYNGFIANPNAYDFSTSLSRVVQKPKGSMKSDCKKIASKYDWDCIISKLSEHYDSLIVTNKPV